MKMEILQFGEATSARLDAFRMLPTFRKATRAMALACASIEDACNGLEKTAAILKSEPARFGLVCGSAFGELETTQDFLKMFADTGVARPLLFQNSLHNSTSGFASIHFHFTGPVITVSHGLFAFENGLETASLLLSQKQADFVFVTYVETSVKALADSTGHVSGHVLGADASAPIDMSMSLLLTTSEIAARENLKSLATIHDVSCHRKVGAELPTYSTTCLALPTAIARFRKEIQSATHAEHKTPVAGTTSSGAHSPALHEFSISHSKEAVSRFKWSHG